jgi:hypothetical protein
MDELVKQGVELDRAYSYQFCRCVFIDSWRLCLFFSSCTQWVVDVCACCFAVSAVHVRLKSNARCAHPAETARSHTHSSEHYRAHACTLHGALLRFTRGSSLHAHDVSCPASVSFVCARCSSCCSLDAPISLTLHLQPNTLCPSVGEAPYPREHQEPRYATHIRTVLL